LRINEEGDIAGEDLEDHVIRTIFGAIGTNVISLRGIRNATSSDNQLTQVRDCIVNGWPADHRAVPMDLRVFYAIRYELSSAVNGQCIVRGSRTVIPPSLRTNVLELAHEGQPGIGQVVSDRCSSDTAWLPTARRHTIRRGSAPLL